jgi:hypothetical protein
LLKFLFGRCARFRDVRAEHAQCTSLTRSRFPFYRQD